MTDQDHHECSVIMCECGNIIQQCTCIKKRKPVAYWPNACSRCKGSTRYANANKNDIALALCEAVGQHSTVQRLLNVEPLTSQHYLKRLTAFGYSIFSVVEVFHSLQNRLILKLDIENKVSKGILYESFMKEHEEDYKNWPANNTDLN